MEQSNIEKIRQDIAEQFKQKGIVSDCIIAAGLDMHLEPKAILEALNKDESDNLFKKLADGFADAIVEFYYHSLIDSKAVAIRNQWV